MERILGFVIAMCVTMALIPPLMHAADRWHFLDQPGERKVHSRPIPRIGGIAMAVGILLALAVLQSTAPMLRAYCAGVVVLLIFGVWDDRATLSAGPKFLGQALAVGIAMHFGDIRIDTITLDQRYEISAWISLPLTFLFLLGATNAINLADGLDGLAGGATLMCLCALALLAFTVGHPEVGGIALVLVGAVLGFLRFNTHPARVFMGDAGSQILGFSVAALSVTLTQDQTAPLSSALPLLLLGIPVIDTLMVMVERLAAGRSPFKADRSHIHHRLLSSGFDHHEAVMVIYCLQTCLFVAAWFMRYESDLVIVGVFAVALVSVIGALRAMEVTGWRVRRAKPGEPAVESPLRRRIRWIAAPERLPRWSLSSIAFLMLLYAMPIAAFGAPASGDIRWLATALAGVLLGCTILRDVAPQVSWIEKAALYLSAVLFVYLDEWTGARLLAAREWQWVLFPVLALSVALRVRLSSERRFTITPLDLLVILMAVVLPNLPGSIAAPHTLGVSAAKLVVLFYAMEALSNGIVQRGRWLSIAVLSVLTLFTLRSV